MTKLNFQPWIGKTLRRMWIWIFSRNIIIIPRYFYFCRMVTYLLENIICTSKYT